LARGARGDRARRRGGGKWRDGEEEREEF